jgi:diacylglycerol kinase (ATP)
MTGARPSRVGVVANPVAGRSAAPERWNRVLAEIRQRFPTALVRPTQSPGDERKAVGELLASPVDEVWVAGGDGSLHLVVDVLLSADLAPEQRPALGFIPLGSGNDFARGLGIPLDPIEAVRSLERADEKWIDVGRLTFLGETPTRSAFWLNQCYLGFGAAVVDRVARSPRPADQSAYVRSALRELLHVRPHQYRLKSDDRPLESVDAMNLLVTNGRYSGSGMLTSPHADPTDGILDIVFVAPVGRIRLLTGLRRFREGTHLSLPEVRTWRTRRFEVETDDPRGLVEADGDIVGRLPARYEVVPRALRVLLPAARSKGTPGEATPANPSPAP